MLKQTVNLTLKIRKASAFVKVIKFHYTHW